VTEAASGIQGVFLSSGGADGAVNRYHPKDDLFGPLGLLNLERQRLECLIKRVSKISLRTNCVASDCVLPQARAEAQVAASVSDGILKGERIRCDFGTDAELRRS